MPRTNAWHCKRGATTNPHPLVSPGHFDLILTEDELVRANLPLVHYAVAEIAAKIPRHVSRDDLISAGMAGLAQAARNFDVERGISFDRYASTRIRGASRRASIS